MPIYSEDRVRRLRMVLWAVVVIGLFVVVLAVVTLAATDHHEAGIVAVVVAALLLGSSGTALRVLPDAERPAKAATIITGVLCIVSGVLTGSWVAFLLLVVGLGLLFLAVLPDDPQGAR